MSTLLTYYGHATFQFVQAKRVVPCHYNTFPPIKQDANAFAANLKESTGIDCTVMNAGDRLSL